VPEKEVLGKKMTRFVTESWECVWKTCLEMKRANLVNEPPDCLSKA